MLLQILRGNILSFFFLVDNLITTFDCGKGNRAIPEIHAFNANYFPDFS